MQSCSSAADEGVGIEADLCDDLRHGQRVDDIRGAVLADLVGVLVGGVIQRLVDELHIQHRAYTGRWPAPWT